MVMKHRTFGVTALLLCAIAAPALAQSKAELQIFLDMRVLQTQVAQLTLAVNQLAEKVKGTDARIEAQASQLMKGFNDQKTQLDALASQQRTLNNSESDSALRILQLSSEIKTIREGLVSQQTVLNEILTHLQQTGGAGAATGTAGDPSAPPGTTAARTPASIPASPSAIYNNAKDYFYKSDYNTAITLLGDAIKRYPDSPEAVLAQLLIGDSWVYLGGHNPEALAAYALVIKNYNDPDRVSDAYYKQGQVYEATNQKDAAIKSYQDCVAKFPNNSAATLATQALKRLGVIK